jgi:hypothetical protein
MSPYGRRWHRAIAVIILALQIPFRSDAQGPDASTIIEQFDIPDDGDLMLVPVVIRERRQLFFVDTGCSHVVYDTSLRHLLGKPHDEVMVRTLTGTIKAEVFNAPEAKLGRLDLRVPDPRSALPVACVDLSEMRVAQGEGIRGVLGQSFLREHIIRLDFDLAKIFFLRAAGNDAGIAIRMMFVGDQAFVQTELCGIGKAMLNIDTGLAGLSGFLHPLYTKALESRRLFYDLGTRDGIGAAGAATRRVLRLPWLQLSTFRHSGLVFSEHSENLPSSIGLGYLSRYIVTFDFPNSLMYLRPSKHFARRDNDDFRGAAAWGISLARHRGEVMVETLAAGRPGKAAGILPGDVLLAVNGQDVRRARLFSIHRRFTLDENEVRLTVRRGDSEITKTIRRAPDWLLRIAPVARREPGWFVEEMIRGRAGGTDKIIKNSNKAEKNQGPEENKGRKYLIK